MIINGNQRYNTNIRINNVAIGSDSKPLLLRKLADWLVKW